MTADFYAMAVSLPAIVLGLTVHEFAHAWAAFRLGDPTAKYAGRLTLEPWVHLDPVGFLMILFYRFGWARPVPVDPRQMREPRRGLALSALAGPAANLLLAVVFGLLWASGVAGLAGQGSAAHLERILLSGVLVNAGLFVFNLLPVPPLDGARIVAGFAPVERWSWWATLDRYGPLLLLLLLVSGAGSFLIGRPANQLVWWIVHLSTGLMRMFG